MEWSVSLSNQAQKYLKQRHIPEEVVFETVRLAVRKAFGEPIAINFTALTGAWKGYYRVRAQKMRVVFSIDIDLGSSFVEIVDNRDRVYRSRP